MARILVVDDDRKTVATIALYLRNSGHTVVEAYSGSEAVELYRAQSPDLIVLDLMLPGIDGTDVSRLVRLDSDVPVIMLTARTFESDRLAGFAAGADDYVTKPFSPRELIARVEAILRRSAPTIHDQALSIGPVSIDVASHEVWVRDLPVRLTRSEFRVLETLARHPGQVFPRGELVRRVFGESYAGLDRSIDTHVSNLRQKLHAAGVHGLIETIHGVGFKLRGTRAQ